MASQYWVRTGQKVQGPFSGKQLIYWASINKLKRNHLISIDRKKWIPAARVKGLQWPEHSPTSESQAPKEIPNQQQAVDTASEAMLQQTGGERMVIPHDQRLQNQKTQLPVTEIPGRGLFPQSLKGDLTKAVRYAPSGVCDDAGKLFAMLPLSAFASIVGSVIGGVVGALCLLFVGFFKIILWDLFCTEPGEPSAKQSTIVVGTILGAGMGFYFGLRETLAFANRWSHNRSRALSLIYSCSIVLITLCSYVALWVFFLPYEELGDWWYVGLFGGFGVFLIAGSLATVHSTKFRSDEIYCEKCKSYLGDKRTVLQRFA